ncbi:hypothetical protein [Nocardia rhizosphaerae]|uniref:Uncharacterized protein n=1 Tax=Nocardia rhizosphaerae TaxID=1691571 RepID=A0ABV8LF91_9NOCA
MPHFYRYLHDPSWVIESEEPRPDLLEWAWWTEIEAPAKPKPEPAPEPEPEPEPEPAAKPAAKSTRRTKAA